MPGSDSTTTTPFNNTPHIEGFPHLPLNAYSLTNRKPHYGVGINDACYQVKPKVGGKRVSCRFYETWHHMVQRCYSARCLVRRPSYRNCTVAPEWLSSFMAFRAWMIQQDWRGKQLDKDILHPGNKIYSSETCIFVTHEINNLLSASDATRGKYPQGVSWEEGRQKYQAKMQVHGTCKNLGRYSTAEEASSAYRNAKAAHIRAIAGEQNQPLKSALYRWGNIYDPHRITGFDWVLT